ncbi:hypothetical protein [cf. Phormidesmis sp. LEGE 11477]|uniref:hypothetical protein n=1 Tax=cf. Phormidesmis sp. LEGE 11477 TaxID=1828680 RepID=UPI00187E935C|nr:hypothetical protein [cf. Phormidesmis sp. LEGE 11477]MBE9064360.1 hypothetical protein [cf. Phormidesmis sp. LEGE 11477]
MIVNTSTQPSVTPKKHRQPRIIRSLQWFWRFSRFYGEYTVRSPQARQQWVEQQRHQVRHCR